MVPYVGGYVSSSLWRDIAYQGTYFPNQTQYAKTGGVRGFVHLRKTPKLQTSDFTPLFHTMKGTGWLAGGMVGFSR